MNRTSEPDIYAVGDAVEKDDRIGGGTSLIALANIANRQGGASPTTSPGTRSIPSRRWAPRSSRFFDLTAATTGWNERRLTAADCAFRAVHSHPSSHAAYYPGAENLAMKLLFDPGTGRILGAQAVGRAGVDKRIDVVATAMFAGVPPERLADLELAYAPPYSSAKDPVNMLGYMVENIRCGDCDVVEPGEVRDLVDSGWTLLDVRSASEFRSGALPGSVNAPLDRLRESLEALGEGPFLVYCEVGQRGHTATMLLGETGREARNLDGGYRTWLAWEAAHRRSPSSDDEPAAWRERHRNADTAVTARE